MAYTQPGNYANEREALRPHYPDYNGPRPPKKRRIRNLVKRISGRKNKTDG